MNSTDKTDAGVNGIIGSEATWIKTFCNDYTTNFPRAGLWYNAMMELKPCAFKIWMYCAAYPFDKELDEGITKWLFNMDREDFCAAINELSNSGYLRMDNSGFQFSRDGAWSLFGNSSANS